MINKKNIFEKIIKKKKSKKIVYQDNLVTAFYDIHPKALIHILIIPNKFIKNLNHIKKNHFKYINRMIKVAIKIAKKKNIHKNGYRIIINCNKHGGQEIKYLHLHLLGGCKLKSI
ncbi:Purine nucleoside phosphoramidase [Buchnera aphidicola (Drepanosiphum platanoidis)]